MNYNHQNHIGGSLVLGFCKECKNSFCRDGDLMSFSTTYSTLSYKTNVTINDVQNYREWLLFAGDFCDACLPPMPEIVKQDIIKENERRQKDILDYNESQNIQTIPEHLPRDLNIERENENDNNNARPALQRKRNIREKAGLNIPNALRNNRRNNQGEIKK